MTEVNPTVEVQDDLDKRSDCDGVILVGIGWMAVKPRWTGQNRTVTDTSKPATTGVAVETNRVLLRGLLGAQVGLDLGAPAGRSALEDGRVTQEPIEERVTAAVSASSLPQSSTGRFDVKRVDARS